MKKKSQMAALNGIRECTVPTPGSDAAQLIGCTCPVCDNNHGKGYMHISNLFIVVEDCPVHNQKESSNGVV